MSIATHPRTYATVTGTAATFTATDGHTENLLPADGEDIRHAVVRRATREAARTGTPVELVTSGDRGDYHLLVDTTGPLGPMQFETPTSASATRAAADRAHTPGVEAPEPKSATTSPADPAAVPETKAPRSFITSPEPTATHPAGWHGFLTRLGLHLPPSTAEVERARLLEVVARQWAGYRTLAVVNGKGGVGKTMTTAMLAAVYAREGGGTVLAWDNNDTRGTLGWRTEQGRYDTTVRDLLPAAPTLLSLSAGVSDIARYVHHQQADRYDVLRSNPELLATDQRILTPEFDVLMHVAAHYYRLIIFDSGNDESADRWLRMIDSSYQLVVPTLANPESAESARLLLDALTKRDDRSAQLARNAVVVVTQSETNATTTARQIAHEFTGTVRRVQIVPFDPALKAGPLRFDSLRPRTRDAWIRVAAAAADIL